MKTKLRHLTIILITGFIGSNLYSAEPNPPHPSPTPSPIPAPWDLQIVRRTFNQGELLNLTNPIVFLPGIPGKRIIPHSVEFHRNFRVWYQNNVAMIIGTEGPPGAFCGIGQPDCPTFYEQNNPDAIFPCPAGYYLHYGFWGGYITPNIGAGVYAVLDAPLIGGGPQNTMEVTLFYYVR